MQEQFNVFLTTLNHFVAQLVAFFPKLVFFIMIIGIGWACAKLVQLAAKRLLILTNFDEFSQKSGIEAFMQHSELNLSLGHIILSVIYWLVLLLFVITGANSLGLTEIALMLHKLVAYLPKIIVAIFVVIFGTLLARFLNRLIFAWLHSLKFEGALAISTSTEYVVQIFALFVALEQLEIGTQLLTALFVIVFGAIFLALAIAFGLGGRDWASQVLQQIQTKR